MTIDKGQRKQRIRRTEPPAIHTSRPEQRALDERLDEALCETFPASDPVAIARLLPERRRCSVTKGSGSF